MKNKIRVNLKFYSGLDKELNIKNYDPETGIIVDIYKGESLKKVLKRIGPVNLSDLIIFKDMEQVSCRIKLKDGDTLFCLKMAGGG